MIGGLFLFCRPEPQPAGAPSGARAQGQCASEDVEVEPARFQDDPAARGECPAGLCVARSYEVAWSYESHQPSGCPDSS